MSVYSEYLSKMWKLDCNLVALRRRPAEQISYRVLIEPLSNVLVTRAPNVIIYKLLHRAVFFSRYELNFVALAMLKFSKFRGNMRFSMNQRKKYSDQTCFKNYKCVSRLPTENFAIQTARLITPNLETHTAGDFVFL